MERRGQEVHLDRDEARAGDNSNVVRYVLLISLSLAIIALTAIWMTGALTADKSNASQAPKTSAVGGAPSNQDGGS